jgi:CHAT domain-containing protein
MSETPEFVVDIEPGPGSTVRLCVHASGLVPIEDEVERALPSFPPADLDELRSGDATEQVTEGLAHQVTTWLLQNDLRGLLGTAFNAATAPFRIVFRPHPKLLADLADIPFELLKLDTDSLVLLQKVRSIVHMQKRRRSPPASAGNQAWPLRILIVRSNPPDLGGEVPPARSLCESILTSARSLSLGSAVQVKLLSSEPGASGAVTYDALCSELQQTSYSVLVYLGHGDLLAAGAEGLPPTGVLQFEIEGSPYANPIRAEQLRHEMQNSPVPLVVLAGCLTAASDAVVRRLPQWMRGSQSVAQSLVYGESGVQCAVGMRYRLETADALFFLKVFFQSLIARTPGNVEQAVYMGRGALFQQKPYPPSWSAPTIFRAAGVEPLFEWMRRPPEQIDPLDELDERMRQQIWRALSSIPRDAQPESRAFPGQLLERVESGFVERRTQRGASLIWPASIEARPGELAHACLRLNGSLELTSLEGRLTFPDALTARAARPSAALKAAGFRVLFGLDQQGTARFLVRSPSAAPAAIPSGVLLEFDIEVPATAPAVYGLSVDSLEGAPQALVRGWSNAIVVSPP